MIDGIINVYKEPGFTSFDVVAKLRGILHQKKIGHTGTLDPMAEGVLVVCLGKATKLSNLLPAEDKNYKAGVKLGIVTDTDDITGKVVSSSEMILSDELPSEERIREVVYSFVGKYDQIPPMYSAVKKNGKKLYEYARAGIAVEREARPVEFFSIENLVIESAELTFDVHCSKGTYIRSLARDIGEKLGCGATLLSLTRDMAHGFLLTDSLKLGEIEALAKAGRIEEYVKPVDVLLSMYDKLSICEESESFLRNGNPLLAKNFKLPQDFRPNDGETFRIYAGGEFLALYTYEQKNRRYKPYKMFLS